MHVVGTSETPAAKRSFTSLALVGQQLIQLEIITEDGKSILSGKEQSE